MKTEAGFFTMDQMLAVLAEARRHSERDFLMLLVAYQHACRASEVCKLRTTDVSAGYLCIERLKGSRTTTQLLVSDDNPLLDEKTALEAWVKTVPVGEKLFPITREHFWYCFKRHARNAGLPAHLTRLHNAKHSIAHHLLDAGVTLPELQKFTGHVSLGSLGRYLEPTQAQVESSIAAARRRMTGATAVSA